MLPLVVVGCASGAGHRSVREALLPPPARCAASPDWRFSDTSYFTLKRLIFIAKQLEGTQKYIKQAVQIELPYRWATQPVCEQYTRTLSANVNA